MLGCPKFVSDLLPGFTETYSVGSVDKSWLQAVLQGRNVTDDNLGRLTVGGKVPDGFPVLAGSGVPFVDFYAENPIGIRQPRYVLWNLNGILFWTAISADEQTIKDIMRFDLSANAFMVYSHFWPGDIDLDLADPLGGGSRWRDFGLSRYFFSCAVDSLPSASATYRGVMVRVEGGSGVADRLYVCMKSASGTYSWVQVASG